jgi:hypothetical protein
MGIFDIFKRKPAESVKTQEKHPFDDATRTKFIKAVSDMLAIQKVVATGYSIEDDKGRINRKAIGYVYGFIDAALRSIGQDMSDMSIGVPTTFQVLRHLFPGCEEKYGMFLAENIGKDNFVMLGVMHGGQQYIDFSKPENKGAPMGFARYLIEGDKHE